MAGFENMHDWRLKPQLLYEVLASNLPDDKQPSPNPLQLASALSVIRRHRILHETLDDDSWKAAFDAWNERILVYASSETTDKCWAGICMLGVTSQECSSKRFLENYLIWFQKLLHFLKPPVDSPFLRVATYASLSDLLCRLGTLPSLKKEGISLSRRLIQPILQLLGGDDSECVFVAASLLSTILRYFPSSVQQHFDNAESVLVSKLYSGKFTADISQKLTHCLAFLPKARGDGDCWYSMMQRILLAINAHLNDAFHGFEDANGAVFPLLPLGKDPPVSLGGPMVAAEALEPASKKFWQLLLPRVSSLIQCCCLMLTNPHPMQVIIPLGPLVALVSRILSVNGVAYQQSVSFLVGNRQALLCSELPALHSCALDLLSALIKGVRSRLLPYAANIARLLTGSFKGCVLPALRTKVYTIARTLLLSMGVGMASCLLTAVIDNATADLKGSYCRPDSGSSNMAAETNAAFTGSGDLGQPSISRKRKRLSSHITDHTPRGSTGDLDATHTMAPIQVQIGALQALEALLTVGGSLRSDRWRADVDSLLITVAMNISASSSLVAGCYSEHMADRFEEGMSYTISDVQIAAYKAVLASLLSSCCHRSPYLSRALSLFRKGKQEAGTKLAEFCSHALLALEPLMHPRSVPYPNIPRFTSVGGNQASTASHFEKSAMHFENSDGGWSIPEASGNLLFGSSVDVSQNGLQFGDELFQDDDIYLGWLANGDDPNTDQDHLGCNPEIPIDSLVATLTENEGLQCPAVDEITNMASLESHINDATTVPFASVGNTFSTWN